MVTQADAAGSENVDVPTKSQVRDPAAVRSVAEEWLRAHVGGDVEVDDVTQPNGAGVANETLLIQASRTVDGTRETIGYVARIGSTEHLYLDLDVKTQYLMYKALSTEPQVPSPLVVGFESDTTLFGQPFFVMERVEGRVPADNPPFYVTGWVLELPTAQQREVWRGAVEAMTELHKLDVSKFPFLQRPHLGSTGLEQELNYWLAYAKWCGADRLSAVQAASSWLVTHLPRDAQPGLSWGDSRPSNIIYQGTRVAAVLDWDMASVAGAECDLGWWVCMERAMTGGRGLPPVPGFGSLRETIDLWQELIGRPPEYLDWHLVFNALRLQLVMVRLPMLLLAAGQVTLDQAGQLTAVGNMEWVDGLQHGPPERFESRWSGWDS